MKDIKIALVDDHTMLRSGLATLIDDINGFSVIIESDNGEDFVKKIKAGNTEPDIILLDISMPIMDGFATAEWIKNNLPNSLVIVLSMMDDERSIIRMLRLGARGYILKDGEPESLERAINDVLKSGYHFNEIVNNKLVHSVNSKQNRTDEGALTAKEIDFLKYCCTEDTYKEIANKMSLSPRTIDGYRDQLFEKLAVKTRVGLVLYAIKNEIVKVA